MWSYWNLTKMVLVKCPCACGLRKLAQNHGPVSHLPFKFPCRTPLMTCPYAFGLGKLGGSDCRGWAFSVSQFNFHTNSSYEICPCVSTAKARTKRVSQDGPTRFFGQLPKTIVLVKCPYKFRRRRLAQSVFPCLGIRFPLDTTPFKHNHYHHHFPPPQHQHQTLPPNTTITIIIIIILLLLLLIHHINIIIIITIIILHINIFLLLLLGIHHINIIIIIILLLLLLPIIIIILLIIIIIIIINITIIINILIHCPFNPRTLFGVFCRGNIMFYLLQTWHQAL